MRNWSWRKRHWTPKTAIRSLDSKIADVDEDEVVAAEERGEQIYGPDNDEEEEEETGEEETNGRAEVRAASPIAGYQQRQTERPGYDRRGIRDRNRRGGPRRNFRARPNTNRNQPLITDLLKEGQEVLIQIAKEPIGKKGARITSHIALPGRFLVYMPTVNHMGVSRKIASDEERQRLKRIVTSERENGLGGFIVRTAAANIKEEDFAPTFASSNICGPRSRAAPKTASRLQ